MSRGGAGGATAALGQINLVQVFRSSPAAPSKVQLEAHLAIPKPNWQELRKLEAQCSPPYPSRSLLAKSRRRRPTPRPLLVRVRSHRPPRHRPVGLGATRPPWFAAAPPTTCSPPASCCHPYALHLRPCKLPAQLPASVAWPGGHSQARRLGHVRRAGLQHKAPGWAGQVAPPVLLPPAIFPYYIHLCLLHISPWQCDMVSWVTNIQIWLYFLFWIFSDVLLFLALWIDIII